jgi:DNA-binding NtrC family response regulator
LPGHDDEGDLPVPARVVVVQNDSEFVEDLAAQLRAKGYDVATFPYPLAAWGALEAAARTEVLVADVEFPPGKSNGVALAHMARSKRPEIWVLFTAPRKYAEAVEGVGDLMMHPVRTEQVAEAVVRLLEKPPN